MDIYEALLREKQAGRSCVMVTVVDKSGEGPLSVGKKMLVKASGQTLGTVGGGAIEYAASSFCQQVLEEKKSLTKAYVLSEGAVVEASETLPMACGGQATLFYDYIGPKGHVYVFGAGHVGRALGKILQTMPYYITVVDAREPVLSDYTYANEKHLSGFSDYIQTHGIKKDAYVIVCTPSHKEDYEVINHVIALGLKPKYIGMLCSKTKLSTYLEKTYHTFGSDVDLSYLYSPIGLDIGGQSPEEIAVSITAEILAIEYGKTGHKHMRGDY